MRFGCYAEEADDVRDDFLRTRHGRRRLESKCSRSPDCGCPICEPREPEDETSEQI